MTYRRHERASLWSRKAGLCRCPRNPADVMAVTGLAKSDPECGPDQVAGGSQGGGSLRPGSFGNCTACSTRSSTFRWRESPAPAPVDPETAEVTLSVAIRAPSATSSSTTGACSRTGWAPLVCLLLHAGVVLHLADGAHGLLVGLATGPRAERESDSADGDDEQSVQGASACQGRSPEAGRRRSPSAVPSTARYGINARTGHGAVPPGRSHSRWWPHEHREVPLCVA